MVAAAHLQTLPELKVLLLQIINQPRDTLSSLGQITDEQESLLPETFGLYVFLFEAFVQRAVLLVLLLEIANKGSHVAHLKLRGTP